MKKLSLFLAAFCVFVSFSSDAQNIFSNLRSNIVDHYISVTNSPTPDAKLAKSLLSALKTIDKNTMPTNLPTGIKTLGSAIKVLSRTSISNEFQVDLHAIIDTYISNFTSSAVTYSNQLASAFPSSQRTSAQTAIATLLGTLANAGTNTDLAAVVKLLGTAVKQTTSIQKLVTSAVNVPPPAASVTATVSISGSSDFHFVSQTAVGQQNAPGNFIVNAAETSGSGLGTTLHGISFLLLGLVDGVNNVNITSGAYTRTAISGGGAFPIDGTGSAQVTLDSANKTLFGTFSFNVAETGGARTGTVTGSFTVYYQ